jgi:hypothetical protein
MRRRAAALMAGWVLVSAGEEGWPTGLERRNGGGGQNAFGRRPSPTYRVSCLHVDLLHPYLPAVSPPAIATWATCRNSAPGNNYARRAARRPPPATTPLPPQACNERGNKRKRALWTALIRAPPRHVPHATPLCPGPLYCTQYFTFLHSQNRFLHSHNLGCTISLSCEPLPNHVLPLAHFGAISDVYDGGVVRTDHHNAGERSGSTQNYDLKVHHASVGGWYNQSS